MRKAKQKTPRPPREAPPGAAEPAAPIADLDDDRRRIRALLELPITQRMNFLRVKIGKGSAL